MSLLLCYSRMKQAPLTATTGHVDSCAALTSIVQPWEELFVDELYSPLVPILALAYEHDPDPEMRPYKDGIDAERGEKLILGAAAGVTAIYEYFEPERRRIAAELGGGRRLAEGKIGRNHRIILISGSDPRGQPFTASFRQPSNLGC